jgi:hypothetical protein
MSETEQETWELVPCHRAPIIGEIRYLRYFEPNPAEPLAQVFLEFYRAVWDGANWRRVE